MGVTTWTCQRQAHGIKCKHRNPSRKRKCELCGKPRPPRTRPAHLSALELSYAEYIVLNGGEFCGLCGALPKPNRKLDRDHDHSTGKPRGLLCRKHNRMLKRWVTDDFMRAALAYLKRTEEAA